MALKKFKISHMKYVVAYFMRELLIERSKNFNRFFSFVFFC